jgi:hypothetical protein
MDYGVLLAPLCQEIPLERRETMKLSEAMIAGAILTDSRVMPYA